MPAAREGAAMKHAIVGAMVLAVTAAGAAAAARPTTDQPDGPQVNGPFGNFNPRRYGCELVDDLAQAKSE
jgi:hypothetical protein